MLFLLFERKYTKKVSNIFHFAIYYKGMKSVRLFIRETIEESVGVNTGIDALAEYCVSFIMPTIMGRNENLFKPDSSIDVVRVPNDIKNKTKINEVNIKFPIRLHHKIIRF